MDILRKLFISILAISLLVSCQDEIEIDIPSGESRLVVEAWFKSDSTTQKVVLTRSVDFTADESSIPESNANVYITTNGGNRYDFNEIDDSGIYSIDSTEFIVYADTVYTLNIRTEDGEIYSSEEEVVPQVPVIDHLIFMEHPVIEDFGFGDFVNPEFLYAGLTYLEIEGYGNNYVWKLYLNGEDQSLGNNLFSTDDSALEDGARIPFELAWFPNELLEGDTVRIEQMTITENTSNYFEQLSDQINGGGPFSTPPAPVLGNMKNVNDDNELVLGVFIVSSVYEVNNIISTENIVNTSSDLPLIE